ncbi:TetR/AcrR family transcriptional regulator [Chitinophaga arvensicola]|uniref:DNA-binding transcriptional regulator, AcrR family n=1 Tax=Chitinophaga arvensicola TaxID=29529 RepID=A0A1I0S9B6_9BACT|nr:TetR/AcrR family transcriptional regulator [Chitinophaga arvensicola]SEW52663.1 DNA-binding transcriptional regulator, AcrR family [Chitinophaga arvensicola]
MNTREKILATALRLFNEQGIDVITIRHIAKEMGISHSNIQYYFPNADEIIATIYVNHIEELNELPIFMADETHKPAALKNSIIAVLEHIYQYRFIYIHFVVIARRMPELKKVYAQRFKIRRTQFLQLFEDYRKQGIVRADIPAPVWENLIRSLYIIGDFWISANELTTGLKGKKAVTYYAGLLQDLFYPYLTKKGQQWVA